MISRRSTTKTFTLALVCGMSAAGAGCGSSSPPKKPVGGGRPSIAAQTQATKAQLAAMHRQVLASQHQHSQEQYGQLPAFLATRQGDPNRVLSASATRPARTTQGAPIRLQLGTGRATATAIGPSIPLKLQGTDVESAPARFQITFTRLRGDVPLHSKLFGIVDEHGGVHVPAVDVQRHGRSAEVNVRLSRLASGEGQIVYAPAGHPLATWDFTLETY